MAALAEDQFTLHRRLWGGYRRLPRLAQVWIVLAAIGGVIELGLRLSGPGEEQRVRDAVALAVREATGPDPSSGCNALSQAGLSAVQSEFGAGQSAPVGVDPLTACQALAVRLRAQATPQEVADLANGSVRTVQFRSNGSALVLFVAADHRLGAKLTMSQSGGRWLIDDVTGGELASAS